MTQEQIKQLAQKFLDGTATEEEKKLLHDWYDGQNPAVSEPETVFTKEEETEEDLKFRMLANLKILQQPVSERKAIPFTWIRTFTKWSTVAAAVVILGFFFWVDKNKTNTPETNTISVHAPLGKTLAINLPDGSHVWLNAGSSMTYPKSFTAKTREVILKEGQAFFDIVHQSKRPFIVHAKSLDITVLGTSFDVKAYKNDPDIKVTVKTGKVGVTLIDKPNQPAMMLLPAEQVTVPEKTAKIQITEISKPAIAPWKENRLVFEDEMLSEVFRVLEEKIQSAYYCR
ncbi:FecR family protein [Dyadobacter sp. NIV53]|uniref:FecR family protein n=1 Tax=Dyadobacter sp. NIV53 TaxID=2861765 RepID=UPI001C867357|nr:FecR domain-containing protein [Dyadobacter sp. NIV53]